MVDMSANTTKILAEFAITAKLNDLLTELITPVIADCFGCSNTFENSISSVLRPLIAITYELQPFRYT